MMAEPAEVSGSGRGCPECRSSCGQSFNELQRSFFRGGGVIHGSIITVDTAVKMPRRLSLACFDSALNRGHF